ncbi:hypothetical protein QE109_00145 [Fusibacter bizertensis]|uniref:Uncharacterized protein n=1 Tax=Fusibacter bizertensis TaxID=1488331 RepID=A0ABT6N7X5_9FIRM|nr:hypothetical protein [Fusibacter bizertensis]MDH8676528.1 hypothetical protein [Fusibacter bizertensis]
MNKRILLLLLLVLSGIILSGCGADITHYLNINSDFSGDRSIIVKVDSEDLENIKGGEPALTKVLTENKPSDMLLTIDKSVENEVIYNLVYTFENFEEYKIKTERIISTPFNATYNSSAVEDNPFKHHTDLTEDNIFNLLTKWAIDAIDESNIVSESSSYFINSTKTYINLNGEEFSQSNFGNNSKFQKDILVPFENVEVNLDLDANNHSIIMSLDNVKASVLELENIKNLLNEKYNTEIKTDDTQTHFIMQFNGNVEFENFLQNSNIGNFYFISTLENPLNMNEKFDMNLALNSLWDGKTKANLYALNVSKINAFENEYSTFNSSCETDLTSNDLLQFSSKYDFINFNYNFSKELNAENINVSKIIESQDEISNIINLSINSDLFNDFDSNEIKTYLESEGYKVEILTTPDITNIELEQTLNTDHSISNTMGLQSFYKTIRQNMFSDYYIHYYQDYNYDLLIPSKEFNVLIKINKKTHPELVSIDHSTYDKENINKFLVGEYYEFESSILPTGNLEILLSHKSSIMTIVVFSISVATVIVLIFIIMRKRKKTPKTSVDAFNTDNTITQ